ncbi:DUF1289 domain-containing protein [Croceicoccus hydrothermalis]|uniref:DUF1289 domain-containing protein n=1 Tax=Croceicoccus hydrothermalis TaxID=2867964 RepID=UPI001EFA379E|nr:DUF1289 domain-containing protein [Croceicoccus hydrothermalis]
MTIPSPCRKVCTLDDAGEWCTACGRTLDEITRWATLAPKERKAIMAQLPERLDGGPGDRSRP